MKKTVHCCIRAAIVGSIAIVPLRAQCLEFDPRFAMTGTNAFVRATVVFDDGTGPALYLGGEFRMAGNALAANRIVRYDGENWSPLDVGTNDVVRALAVFDDGSGAALYVGGDFTTAGGIAANRIAKWDGTTWSALDGGVSVGTAVVPDVESLAVFDDGTGPALFVGGNFTMAGSVPVNHIAKWDGAQWSALGSGLVSAGTTRVGELEVFDDGGGGALYAGGSFTTAGGASADRIAKWDGVNWTPLGSGLGSSPSALAVFDDGTGAALYAGGSFTTAGGGSANRVAKWDGATWSALGAGIADGGVSTLGVYDDGGGAALYAGGTFNTAGSVAASKIAKWNGAMWSSLGGSFVGGVFFPTAVTELTVFDGGSGNELFVCGNFTELSSVLVNRVARWNGTTWSATQPAVETPLTTTAMLVHDDGSGPALFVGAFANTGLFNGGEIAKWDGATWSTLGAGVTGAVSALCTFDDGGGPALYAGGNFTTAGALPANRVAKWDGSAWSPLGSGTNDSVLGLAVFDDGSGPALYAAGEFTLAGGVSALHVARWNGAGWSAVGSGLGGLAGASYVRALTVFDDGTGAALYAGGQFGTAGPTFLDNVAKWDGSTWSAVGSGWDGFVTSLIGHDDGSGPALYAAGNSFDRVEKWDGAAWSAVGGGLDSTAYSLAVFDDGDGPALYAGGNFEGAGGSPANHVAKWDGVSWSPLGDGISAPVYVLCAFEDGTDGDPDLYLGGTGWGLAEWHGCPSGEAYCFGDGLDPVVTASCPCGNFGDPGHGCSHANPLLGGARLFASGNTNPNTIVLTCTNAPNNTLCTFLRGKNHDPEAAVFGDGIKCVNPPLVRFGQQNSGQGGNPQFTVAVPAPTEVPGNTFHYTVQYRNPVGGFCLPALFNASNGYTLDW